METFELEISTKPNIVNRNKHFYSDDVLADAINNYAKIHIPNNTGFVTIGYPDAKSITELGTISIPFATI